MEIAIWLPLAAGVLAASAPVTGGMRGKLDHKQLARLERRHGLPLPPELRAPVVAAIRRREVMTLICGTVALVVAAAGALVAEWLHVGDTSALIVAAVAFGASLGGFVAVLRARDRLLPDAPRVARPVETGPADYLARGERIAFFLAPVAMTLGLIAGWVAWGLLRPPPGFRTLPVTAMSVTTVVLLAVWALLALAQRVLLDRPQFAHSDLELAWDDCLRAEALRGLVGNGVALGVMVPVLQLVLVGSVVITPEVRAGQMELTLWLGVGMLVVTALACLMVLVPYALARDRNRHFLGLWRGRDFARAASC